MNKKILLILLICVFIFSPDCHAYIDPGKGSGFQQIIANGFSGMLALIGSRISNWIKFFKDTKKEK